MQTPFVRSLVASTSLRTATKRTALAAPSAFFTTALPRFTQHETTETPARAHRSPRSNSERDTMTGEPTNSSSQFKVDSAEDHLSRLRDIASGLTPGAASTPSHLGGGADVAAASSEALPGQSSSSDGLASSSSSSSVSEPPLPSVEEQLATAGYGYTPFNLPTKSDEMIESFINHLQRDGKKSLATKQVLGMMKYLSIALNSDPLPALTHAIELASPMVKIQTKKQGAKNIPVPAALTTRQMRRKAIVGIINASKKKNDREIERRLAKEVLGILEGNSETLRKKEDVHRDAVRNRSNLGVRV